MAGNGHGLGPASLLVVSEDTWRASPGSKVDPTQMGGIPMAGPRTNIVSFWSGTTCAYIKDTRRKPASVSIKSFLISQLSNY